MNPAGLPFYSGILIRCHRCHLPSQRLLCAFLHMTKATVGIQVAARELASHYAVASYIHIIENFVGVQLLLQGKLLCMP
jgi:hypothetical protein